MAYELKSPNHRLTAKDLDELKANSDHVTSYLAIHLAVFHMTTHERHAIPDHDVYVNTKEMTYCIELHGRTMCLIEERGKDRRFEHFKPCQCHKVPCRKCHAPFMAMTLWCSWINSCNEVGCEYCTHYRDNCAAEELTTEIIERANSWYENPQRDAAKTSYHLFLERLAKGASLTMAQCYGIAITEVFYEEYPECHPVVEKLLDKVASRTNRPVVTDDCWCFEDWSFLENLDGLLYDHKG